MIITMKFGRKNEWEPVPQGNICIDTGVWFREKGGVRDLRKLLKLATESDRLYGTDTMQEWRQALADEPVRIRARAVEITHSYNRNCESIRKVHDKPGMPFSLKQEALQKMDEALSAEQKRYCRQMKSLVRDLKRAEKLIRIVEEEYEND